MPHPVWRPASYFRGRWQVSRRVCDVAADVEGCFVGTATFTRGLGRLDYVEDGELDFGGRRGPAGRVLRYRPDGPSRLVVEFADGRFFHDLDLRTGCWTMRHRCRDDVYRGEVTIVAPHYWRQVWRVHGPDKQLILDTEYLRVDRADPDEGNADE